MSDTPTRPLIQIDDLVREMTEEEYEKYLEFQAQAFAVPTSPDPA
jgi:hypothetical protein